MKTFGKSSLATLLVLVTLGLAGAAAGAEAYPGRFIEVVVPFAPGGAVDNTVRFIGTEAEKLLGQKLTILNKPAGGSVEGQRYAAQAKPDGYTLLAMTSSLVTNILTKQVNYTLDSYDYLAMYAFDPFVFVASAELPQKTLKELVEASKQKPLAASTPGKANSKHVAGMILEQKTGARFNYVHTKGAAEGVPMIAGNHVQVGCWAWGEVKPLVEQGKIRPIAIMAETRDPDLPAVPTFAELGVPIVYGAWRGLAAPKGLAPEVQRKLAEVLARAIQSPEVRKLFDNAGFPIVYKDGPSFRRYVEEDYQYVKQVLAEIK